VFLRLYLNDAEVNYTNNSKNTATLHKRISHGLQRGRTSYVMAKLSLQVQGVKPA